MKQFFKIYNTETKNVVPFEPRNPDIVTMYTCGPTVYHFAHIGNLRSYIVEDLLEKYMRFIGYNVKRAMNITDVGHLTSDADVGEDKMLVGAKREKKTVLSLLKVKLGNVSNQFEQAIQNSSIEKLNTLTLSIFAITNEDDVLKIIN